MVLLLDDVVHRTVCAEEPVAMTSSSMYGTVCMPPGSILRHAINAYQNKNRTAFTEERVAMTSSSM